VTPGLARQVRLPPAARDLIERLLCDVDDRLGSAGGAAEIKARRRPSAPPALAARPGRA